MINKIMLVPDRHLDEISGGKNCIRSVVGYVTDSLHAVLASSLLSGVSAETCIIVNDILMDDKDLGECRRSRTGTVNTFFDKLRKNAVVDFSRKVGMGALDVHNKVVDSIRKPSECTDDC